MKTLNLNIIVVVNAVVMMVSSSVVSSWIVTPGTTGRMTTAARSPTKVPTSTRTVMAHPKRSSSTTRTALYMFDWFNPNKNKDNASGTSTDEKPDGASGNGGPGDFFSNLFKPMTTPTSPTHHDRPPQQQHPTHKLLSHEEGLPTASSTIEATSVVDEEIEVDIKEIAAAAVKEQKDKAPKVQAIETVVPAESTASLHIVEPTTATVAEDTNTARSTEETPSTSFSSSSETTQIHKGKVKYFDRKKGYGFIRPWVESDKGDRGGYFTNNEDELLFVHFSEIQTPPVPAGQKKWFQTLFNREIVNYQPAVDKNGRLVAKHVTGPNGSDVVSVKKQRAAPKEQKQEGRTTKSNDNDPPSP